MNKIRNQLRQQFLLEIGFENIPMSSINYLYSMCRSILIRKLQAYIINDAIINIHITSTRFVIYIECLEYLLNNRIKYTIISFLEHSLLEIPFFKNTLWKSNRWCISKPNRWLFNNIDGGGIDSRCSNIVSQRCTKIHKLINSSFVNVTDIEYYFSVISNYFIILNNLQKYKNTIITLIRYISKKDIFFKYDSKHFLNLSYTTEYPLVVSSSFRKYFTRIPDLLIYKELDSLKYLIPLKTGLKAMSIFFIVTDSFSVCADNIKYLASNHSNIINNKLEDIILCFKIDSYTPFIQRLSLTKNILLHKYLGTMFDKILRIFYLSFFLLREVSTKIPISFSFHTIYMFKLDLTTKILQKKNDLQGFIGSIYSKNLHESKSTKSGLKNFILSRNKNLFDNKILSCISLFDQIDYMILVFFFDGLPSKKKDLYGLRSVRAQIFYNSIEYSLHYSIKDIFQKNFISYIKQGILEKTLIFNKSILLYKFFFQKQESFLVDLINIDYEIKNKCNYTNTNGMFILLRNMMKKHKYNILNIWCDFKSVLLILKNDYLLNKIILSLKRIKKILSINHACFDTKIIFSRYLQLPEEIVINQILNDINKHFKNHSYLFTNNTKYISERIIRLSILLEKMFEKVLIINDDVELKNSRLILIAKVYKTLSNFI